MLATSESLFQIVRLSAACRETAAGVQVEEWCGPAVQVLMLLVVLQQAESAIMVASVKFPHPQLHYRDERCHLLQ